MFAEDVVLSALKAQASWFVSDHILRKDSKDNDPETAAREIAERNYLRYVREDRGSTPGYRFTIIE